MSDFDYTPLQGQLRPDLEYLRDDLVIAYHCRAQKITPKTVWRPILIYYTPNNGWQEVGQIKAYSGWRGQGYTLRLWGYMDPPDPAPWADIMLSTEVDALEVLRHIAPFVHKEHPLP